MAGCGRPILDAAAGNVLMLLALHQDRPCPTNPEIREWTGVSRRRLAPWLAQLRARGILEIEREHLARREIGRERRAGWRRMRRRRMRAVGGVWTGWSARGYLR